MAYKSRINGKTIKDLYAVVDPAPAAATFNLLRSGDGTPKIDTSIGAIPFITDDYFSTYGASNIDDSLIWQAGYAGVVNLLEYALPRPALAIGETARILDFEAYDDAYLQVRREAVQNDPQGRVIFEIYVNGAKVWTKPNILPSYYEDELRVFFFFHIDASFSGQADRGAGYCIGHSAVDEDGLLLKGGLRTYVGAEANPVPVWSPEIDITVVPEEPDPDPEEPDPEEPVSGTLRRVVKVFTRTAAGLKEWVKDTIAVLVGDYPKPKVVARTLYAKVSGTTHQPYSGDYGMIWGSVIPTGLMPQFTGVNHTLHGVTPESYQVFITDRNGAEHEITGNGSYISELIEDGRVYLTLHLDKIATTIELSTNTSGSYYTDEVRVVVRHADVFEGFLPTNCVTEPNIQIAQYLGLPHLLYGKNASKGIVYRADLEWLTEAIEYPEWYESGAYVGSKANFMLSIAAQDEAGAWRLARVLSEGVDYALTSGSESEDIEFYGQAAIQFTDPTSVLSELGADKRIVLCYKRPAWIDSFPEYWMSKELS